MKLDIYTDGAYSNKRKQGGWSYIILYNDKIIHKDFKGVKNTTNNRMEISAVLKALKYIRRFNYTSVTVYSDSMYVIGTLTMGWSKNKNIDLWTFFDYLDLNGIEFVHVKGHSNNIYNDLCDTLAVIGSQVKIT